MTSPKPPSRWRPRIIALLVTGVVAVVMLLGVFSTGTVYYLVQEEEAETPPVRITEIPPPPRTGRPRSMSEEELAAIKPVAFDAVVTQAEVEDDAKKDAGVSNGNAIIPPNDAVAVAESRMAGGKRRAVGRYGGSTGGDAAAAPILQLDVPIEQSSAEAESSLVPKGCEEAVADLETGGSGTFMALGAGGGNTGVFGNRKGAAKRRALLRGPEEKEQAPQAPALPRQKDLPIAELAQQLALVPPALLLTPRPSQRLQILCDEYHLPLDLAPSAWASLIATQQASIGAGLTNGEQALYLARLHQQQVVPAAGRLAWRAPALDLDPTLTNGFDPAAFNAAWGTPPMAVVARDPQHTFALVEGTSSFQRARADLQAGRLPDPAGIRVEHFINAVPGDYPRPAHEAFALYAEAGRHPFSVRTALVAVGVVGRDVVAGERRPLRLVLGIDASGSMARPGAWDRARIALDGLVESLQPTDRVAVVSFGDRARVVQPVVSGSATATVQAALDGIVPRGSTNLAEGLALSCQVARELSEPGCELRVALVSDGAALAGTDAVAANAWVGGLKAAGGRLLVLTVGERTPDTAALDHLVQAGDGTLVHLASDADARQAVEGTLLPERLQALARDAKAQVTWNPERVNHARLVGYERRRLAHRDFRNDAVDAGEISTAVTVTALFEVVLVEGGHGPLGTAAVRYHDVRLGQVREQACPMPGSILSLAASPRLRPLACAAELAEQLRGSWWANVRPTRFAAIARACAGLPAPADDLAQMAQAAARLIREPEAQP